jgi:hypothetical protein
MVAFISRRMNFRKISISMMALLFSIAAVAAEDDPRGLNGLPEIALQKLTDKNITPMGERALAIRVNEWKHGETTNFVYHFFHGFIATPVSVEAEFYYRFLAKELQKDTSQWERKCHIYIFEKPEDWKEFQKSASLDPWTGGIHCGGDLFIQRNPELKFKGNTLGHEVTHLVVHRFFGSGVPLWLDEGYAENASIRAYASYYRARGYNARPHSNAIAPGDFVPLSRLTSMLAYPAKEKQVGIFYDESEKLVRFFSTESKTAFNALLDGLSKGNRMETALWRSYGGRFPSLDSLNHEFSDYATKDHGTTLQD